MKMRKNTEAKVEQNMTAMIDVVFQLLTFFVMSFKVAAMEGDFNIKMPASGASSASVTDTAPPIKIKMSAGENGTLKNFKVGSNEPMINFKDMTRTIKSLLKSSSSPGLENETEVELDCDYTLKYEYVIKAITAISGEKQSDGSVVKLVQKIKFSPPKAAPAN
jgi:biopolymer transport protein ExbD